MAIQLGSFSDYQYKQNANTSFGNLTAGRGQNIQHGQQGVGEAQPVSNPFATNNNEGLVGRLDRIDAQTISPNTQNDVQGQKLYCLA